MDRLGLHSYQVVGTMKLMYCMCVCGAASVPYERFVVRISEDDFVKNPNLALDSVKKTFLDPTQPALLQRMRGSCANFSFIIYCYRLYACMYVCMYV